jgi:hypothetical protein
MTNMQLCLDRRPLYEDFSQIVRNLLSYVRCSDVGQHPLGPDGGIHGLFDLVCSRRVPVEARVEGSWPKSGATAVVGKVITRG